MSVDIVNLIESNPITNFSGDYQSKLVQKVQENFTDYEQKMFLSSFFCYLKYDSKNDFVIDLDNVWKWLEFSSKHKAKELLNKFFVVNKDHVVLLTPTGEQMIESQLGGAKKDTRGGHNKEIIMLNIETFKRFCLKAGTKKADEIHDYFVKLENIMFEILKEESTELKKQLMQIENTKNKEMEEKLMQQKLLERENTLLDKFASSGSLIYIIKVKTHENGTYVIKIGHSQKGLQGRYNEHKTKYNECLLLDCFSVDKSKDLEGFLHHHKEIARNKVTNLENHEKEEELFLIGNELTYQMVLKIIDENINNYNYRVGELLLENELLRSKLDANQNNINNELISDLVKTINMLSNKITSLEKSNQEIVNKLNASETKTTTGFGNPLSTVGPRLQKINPETLQIVKIYETASEAMKEDQSIKRPSLNKAVMENTVYKNFRWLFVDRELDPNVIHNINPTKNTQIQNTGYIAKLNQNKTEILNVYLDRKTAAHCNEYNSSSALDNHVKNSTITRGHYYVLYDNCEQNLKNDFETKHGKPLLYVSGVGQYDSNNNLIREFSCKYDCIRSLTMSDKTLSKALNKDIMYNGFYFKEIGSKIKLL